VILAAFVYAGVWQAAGDYWVLYESRLGMPGLLGYDVSQT
jgi:hypothetical protein